ncbi:MAG: hypothetical protein NPIRA05_07490 [Nitrospirales bacterium]|nr:MAG: hypothetical protein NPIRA05_07490 [Nitrospirales bacterium]
MRESHTTSEQEQVCICEADCHVHAGSVRQSVTDERTPRVHDRGEYRIGSCLQWAWPLVVMTLLSGSCASVDFGLYKPGGTEEEFSLDETECRRSLGLGGESRIDPSQLLVFFIPRYKDEVRSCLQKKGWSVRPQGI